MIARQRVHVLLSHAVKTAEITVGPLTLTYHITVDDGSACPKMRRSDATRQPRIGSDVTKVIS